MLLPVAGVAVGATQIVRGIANTPESIQQERKGLHWDMQKREWIENPGVALLIDDEVSYMRAVILLFSVVAATQHEA